MNDAALAPYFSGYFVDPAVVTQPPEVLWRAGALVPTALLLGATSKDGTAAFYGTAPTCALVHPPRRAERPAAWLCQSHPTQETPASPAPPPRALPQHISQCPLGIPCPMGTPTPRGPTAPPTLPSALPPPGSLGNVAPDPPQLGPAFYALKLQAAWGPLAPQVAARYPLSRFNGSAQVAQTPPRTRALFWWRRLGAGALVPCPAHTATIES